MKQIFCALAIVMVLFVLLSAVVPINCYAASTVTPIGQGLLYGLGLPWKTYTVDAANLQWAFFSDGVNIYFKTSGNLGQSWSNSTLLRTGSDIVGLSVYSDGATIAYEWLTASYRAGTAVGNGSISWFAGEQATGLVSAGQYSMVTLDSQGYPWICYYTASTSYAARSSTNDGTWSTEFTHGVSAQYGAAVMGTLVPLANRDMAWIGTTTTGMAIRGATYHNASSTWDSPVSGSSGVAADYNGMPFFSAVPYNNGGDLEVMVAFETTSNNLVDVRYQPLTNTFTAELSIQAGVAGNSAPKLVLTSIGREYVFWQHFPDVNTIYYREMDAGTYGWNARQVLIGNDTLYSSYPADAWNYLDSPGVTREDSVGAYYVNGSGNLRWQGVYEYGGAAVSFIASGATSITATTATLNGHVISDGGIPCTAVFNWGASGLGGTMAYVGNLTSGMDFSVSISGLTPNYTYGYWIILTNTNGSYWSAVSYFNTLTTTNTQIPVVITDLATDIKDSSAVLNGRVGYDGNLDTFVGFEYRIVGETEWVYGWNDVGLATQHYRTWRTGDTFAGTLSNLQFHTAYEFAAIAKNSLGNATPGEVKTFTTGYGIYAQPTPTSGGISVPPVVSNFFGKLSSGVKLVIAVVVTVGSMVLVGAKSKGKSSGLLVIAVGAGWVLVFTVFGWYPSYVIILVGGVIAILLFFAIQGRH